MEPFPFLHNVRDRGFGSAGYHIVNRDALFGAPIYLVERPDISMLIRLREVASVLVLVLALLAAKHVPFLAHLPLAHITGIVCFAFAIYLSLRIYEAELVRIRSE